MIIICPTCASAIKVKQVDLASSSMLQGACFCGVEFNITIKKLAGINVVKLMKVLTRSG